MGVSFITGRMGCNKTDKILDLCFQEAKKESQKPIYILVPEKYSYEMEKKISQRLLLDSDPYFRIRVVSFTTLGNIVYSNVGGLTERKISKTARAMLIYKALDSVSNELVTFKAKGSGVGLVSKIMDMIIEFKQNDMSVDEIYEIAKNSEEDSLKHKLNDLAKVYERYESYLLDNYFDTEDNLEFFSKKLDDYKELSGATIFIDEFTGFTPIQYLVIEKLMIYSENIYFSLMTDLKNFNSRTGVFSKTNITFMKINEICQKNSIKRDSDIHMKECEYYDNPVLRHLEKNINEFNPAKYTDLLVLNNKNQYIKDSLKNIDDSLRIIEFKNTHLEVEHIASEITRLVRDEGYRYSEITIAMRDLDSYAYLIRSIFEDYNIGYFLDEKIAAKNNPIIVLVLSILEMKQKNYSYESMFRYLKSGLTPISNLEISMLENYVLANGIKGRRWFDETWDYPITHSLEDNSINKDKDEAYLKTINDIKNKLMDPIERLHNKLKGRNTVSEICRYLYEFTIDINLPEKIIDLIEKFKEEENLYKVKEYSQVWSIFTDMLDEMVEFLADEKIGLERFINLMEAEFDGFELGIIPPARDQVFVTTIDRMKNPEMKVLYLIGVGDGVFPQDISDDNMLTDNDRDRLLKQGIKFDTDMMSRAYDEQFLVYKALSMSMSRLIVSYSVADFEGKSMRPSPLIKKLKKMFPNIKMEISHDEKINSNFDDVVDNISAKERLFDDLISNIRQSTNIEENKIDECWRNVYRYFRDNDNYKLKMKMINKAINYKNSAENMNRNLAGEIYGAGMFSISKLENYVSCPFSYFVNYGLKVKDRELYEFNAMDSGTYSHKILDTFSKRVIINGVDWNDIDNSYIKSEVEKISNQIIEDRKGYILKSSEKHKYLAGRINKNLMDSLEIMSEQIRRGDFLPQNFEVEFGFKGDIDPIRYKLEDGKAIVLTGKIDRVDSYNDGEVDYVRVIDYKSSTRNLDMDKIMAGIQMQLFVYMSAVLKSNKKLDKDNIVNGQGANCKPAALLYSRFNPVKSKVSSLEEVEKMTEKDLEENLLNENKLSGFVIKDKEVIKHLDKTLDEENKKSLILPIANKKGGEIGAHTVGLNFDEFETVSEYVLDKTKEICEEIYSGKIDIHPYKLGDEVPCRFCDFKSICQFDPTIKGNRYNSIKKRVKNKDYTEVLKLMREKIRSKNKERGDK
ncbi:MAG: helicase-exonuclease AddAB subunit AddB [Peptostreptococcus sp.]|uniref:helicase-exonuclease AddAB subunit AddB n=1 Tax=Peptostreptococcus sp. TaxID=1262 RepID=UPI002FC91E6F